MKYVRVKGKLYRVNPTEMSAAFDAAVDAAIEGAAKESVKLATEAKSYTADQWFRRGCQFYGYGRYEAAAACFAAAQVRRGPLL